MNFYSTYLVLGVIIAVLLGLMLGIFATEQWYQEEALDHQCAQFDPKTGAFVWIKP